VSDSDEQAITPSTSEAATRTLRLARRVSRLALALAFVALVLGVVGSCTYVWEFHRAGGSIIGGWWGSIATGVQILSVSLVATAALLFTALYLRLQILRWES
jgi:uncharacterized membrane protein